VNWIPIVENKTTNCKHDPKSHFRFLLINIPLVTYVHLCLQEYSRGPGSEGCMGWQIRKCPISFNDFKQCVVNSILKIQDSRTNNAIAYRSSRLYYKFYTYYLSYDGQNETRCSKHI
jgi:hypothetical protein